MLDTWHPFFHLLVQGELERKPASAFLLAIALFPLFIGGGLFYWFLKKEYDGWSKALKYTTLIIPVIGALVGYTHYSNVQKESYRLFHYLSDRHVNLHQAAFFIPLITLVGMIVWSLLRMRQEKLDM